VLCGPTLDPLVPLPPAATAAKRHYLLNNGNKNKFHFNNTTDRQEPRLFTVLPVNDDYIAALRISAQRSDMATLQKDNDTHLLVSFE
jgi:hypothetical protein